MSKRIGITYDVRTDWQPKDDDPVDINAEFDRPVTVDRIVAAIESAGHTVVRIGNVWKLLEQIGSLDVDIVFNICEGRGGRNRESQTPMILEMNNVPYIGSDALTLGLTLDKVMAKRVFLGEGIPTPRFFVAEEGDDLKKLNTIGFPLMVKTRHEGTSKGITTQSRVENHQQLVEQVERVHRLYKQSAIVEEFIKGTEYTVPVLGNENPLAMPVAQVEINGSVDLGDEFFTSERVTGTEVNYVCPARVSEDLKKKMQALAVAVYKAVDCRDFGRVDFRVDEQGQPYVLEINPLPSLAEKDVFNIFPQTIKKTYNQVVNEIINFGFERNGLASAPRERKILSNAEA